VIASVFVAALLAQATAKDPTKDAAATAATVAAELDHANKCRVHTQMLPTVFADNAGRKRWGEAVSAWWTKESDRLAARLGLSAGDAEIRRLLIPITPDMDFINACVGEAKRHGLKPRAASAR